MLRRVTIIPGYETTEKFVPVVPLEKTQYRTEGGDLTNMLPPGRAMHCISLFIAPLLLVQDNSLTQGRIRSWLFFEDSMLVISGKWQKEEEDHAEWKDHRTCVQVLYKHNTNAN